MSEHETQTWRAVCDEALPHLRVREVVVARVRDEWGDDWCPDGTVLCGRPTPLAAVQALACEECWPVLEYVAPGEMTRDEIAAERSALRAELNAVDDAAHGRSAEHTGTARVVARALADAAQVAESLYAKVADLEARLADLAKDRDTALAAALDLAADRDALRAILGGSEVAPTDAEIEEHAKSGGRWRCVVPDNLHMCADAMHAHAVRLHRAPLDALGLASRWWALDADGRPCPRPVPPSKP